MSEEPSVEELIKKANYEINHLDCINLDVAIQVINKLQAQAGEIEKLQYQLKDYFNG